MKRTDIINHLFDKKIGYKGSYLEIGLNQPGDNYYNIKCAHKDCVDPMVDGNTPDFVEGEEARRYVIKNVITYRMTSDEFFDQTQNMYDVILIDGLHIAEQTAKDIVNAYKHLKKGGYIVIHDCIPGEEASQVVPRAQIYWNGNVWKAIPNLYKAGIDFVVVNTDEGCGIIKENGEKDFKNYTVSNLEYNEVFSNQKIRDSIMHVISEEEFLKM